ncbi:hypothetical protein HK100_012530 [Physocladia obscura]|uniref:Uncharacterized protein n=1 Tax=Physocladia obscura TaxID=109957 RepID=A0AAD5T9S0_9FUNG|nr:hypothetical protein HK100_012530 [Physocladia obscura]
MSQGGSELIEIEKLQSQLKESQERVVDLEKQLTTFKIQQDGNKGQQQEKKQKSCDIDSNKSNQKNDSTGNNFLVSFIDSKLSKILEAIWTANSARLNTQSVNETNSAPLNQSINETNSAEDITQLPKLAFTEIENAIVELTESMEMRTSRIGKMVHEVVGWKDDISFLRSSVEALSNKQDEKVSELESIANDMGSLLAIAAEGAINFRATKYEQQKENAENHTKILKVIEDEGSSTRNKIIEMIQNCIVGKLDEIFSQDGRSEAIKNVISTSFQSSASTEFSNPEFLNEKRENIAEVIDFVNKSQCRLVTLVTEKLQKSLSHSAVLNHDDKDMIKNIQDAISELIAPLYALLPDKSKCPVEVTESTINIDSSVNNRAMNNLLLESLANLDSHLSRNSRELSARQDLIEVWMTRNHETLKLIQQGIHAVEQLERKFASSNSFAATHNVSSFEFESRLDSILSKHETSNLFENFVSDMKETWMVRQEKFSEHLEKLLKEKATLETTVCNLKVEKYRLDEDIENLKKFRDEFPSIQPISNAVDELEKDLHDRITVLLKQIEKLKNERNELHQKE